MMKEVLDNELQGDEQILWSGKENISFFRRGSITQLIFTIFWLALHFIGSTLLIKVEQV